MSDPNTALFLLVNRFAAATGWLHGAGMVYASYGLVLFAMLLLAGWWSARARSSSEPGSHAMVAALWAPIGMLVALGVNQFFVALFAEARPYAVLDHPLLLVAPTLDPAFPSDHAVMAGAVTAGLWLVSRRRGVVAGCGGGRRGAGDGGGPGVRRGALARRCAGWAAGGRRGVADRVPAGAPDAGRARGPAARDPVANPAHDHPGAAHDRRAVSPPLPGIFGALAPVLENYGYLAVGGLLFLEDFGVPAPPAKRS